MGQEVLVCLNSPPLSEVSTAQKSKEQQEESIRLCKSANHSGKNPDRLRGLWRQADAVCFDVDSTVCQDEAIDELASYLGRGEQVKRCTQKAMGGSMTFREALTLRLDIIQPSRHHLETYANTHPIRLTPGVRELINELQARDVHVYLVSGGFRRLIKPVAEALGIPKSNVYANEILFDENGQYAGFSTEELTSDSGSINVGKAGVCGLLKANHGYKTLLMVGDGATDAEACPPADGFIGFGGNQLREGVKQAADWYVYDFESLHAELFHDNGQ